jgi:hypothetical protein
MIVMFFSAVFLAGLVPFLHDGVEGIVKGSEFGCNLFVGRSFFHHFVECLGSVFQLREQLFRFLVIYFRGQFGLGPGCCCRRKISRLLFDFIYLFLIFNGMI